MKNFGKYFAVAAVATLNPLGFTVNAQTLQPITKGYAVALEATQNSFNQAGIETVCNYIADHQEVNAIGGWLNTDNNQYYFDATVVLEDLADAIELGRANHQIAIYDITNGREIRL